MLTRGSRRLLVPVLVLAAGVMLSGCRHLSGPGRVPTARVDTVVVSRVDTVRQVQVDTVVVVAGARGEDPQWGNVTVFFATDRRPERAPDGPDSAGGFGSRRSVGGALHYGTATVTIPRNHRVGGVESPAWYRLEFDADPSRHMVVQPLTVLPGPTAFDTLRAMVARSDRQEAFVFIHGYNVAFKDAVLRTAQLAWDLGFDGAPILYSWPSNGSLVRYRADLGQAEWSAPHLRSFLDSVVAVTGARRVHLIAHSMGAYALSLALRRMQPMRRDTTFNQIVLAAADIDAEVFREDIVPAMRGLARRTTLYASSNDRALIASRLYAGYPRAGQSRPHPVVARGIDTIDASSSATDMLGHGYVAGNRALLSDLFLLLRHNAAPEDRNLRRLEGAQRSWWAIP